MLALTRKVGQSIAIGDDVRVVVVGIEGASVTIGIEAPREVPVHRAEVYDEILRARRKKTKR